MVDEQKDEETTIVYDEPEEKSLTTVQKISRELKVELADASTARALLATTFKKFDDKMMKQALMEGMLRGYTFKDFLQRKIYAIKYGETYNLISSIEHARERGMRNGLCGKDKPEFTFTTKDGKEVLESCTVTVKRLSNGHVGEYAATVYFDEFYKPGKTWNEKYTPSMWDEKPKAMLSKVAEMHALRMAFPEDLSQIYVEEEFDNRPVHTPDRYAEAAVDSASIRMKKTTNEKKPKIHEAEESADGNPAAENPPARG
jgi:hypothetical protein